MPDNASSPASEVDIIDISRPILGGELFYKSSKTEGPLKATTQSAAVDEVKSLYGLTAEAPAPGAVDGPTTYQDIDNFLYQIAVEATAEDPVAAPVPADPVAAAPANPGANENANDAGSETSAGANGVGVVVPASKESIVQVNANVKPILVEIVSSNGRFVAVRTPGVENSHSTRYVLAAATLEEAEAEVEARFGAVEKFVIGGVEHFYDAAKTVYKKVIAVAKKVISDVEEDLGDKPASTASTQAKQ